MLFRYCGPWIGIRCESYYCIYHLISVARRVLKRASGSPLTLEGAELRIQPYIPQSLSNSPHPTLTTLTMPHPCCIVMENIEPGTSKEYLEMFFKKHSVSGEIENLYIDRGTGRAVIEFNKAEGKLLYRAL